MQHPTHLVQILKMVDLSLVVRLSVWMETDTSIVHVRRRCGVVCRKYPEG
jgi:hypothetical protein